MKIVRITATVLLVLWMGLIFSFSAQNSDESSGLSGRVISFVISIFDGDFEELTAEEQAQRVEPFQFVVRKAAHFTIYGILGVFSFFTYITYKKTPFKIRLFLILLTCLLYSISDEIHQTFISGRSGEIRDVCIDFCGSLLFITVLTLIYRSSKFKNKFEEGTCMRKEELINANDELFKRNEELLSTVEELKKKIEELRKEIIKLATENDKLNSKLNATKPLQELEKKITSRAAVSKETEYGASVIGRIVVSAAKYCNILTALPENSMTKEQVNLILGRTEVAKAEILKEISKDIPLEDKKIAIEALEKSAEDYFSSIMAQTE